MKTLSICSSPSSPSENSSVKEATSKQDIDDEVFSSQNSSELNNLLNKALEQVSSDISALGAFTRKKMGKKAHINQSFLDQSSKYDMDDDEDGQNEDRKLGSLPKSHATSATPFAKLKSDTSANNSSENVSKIQNRMQQQLRKILDSLNPKDEKRKSQNGTQQHLKDIFQRLRNLIEHLWEEMHIKQKKRDTFAKQYFYPETLMNYLQIFHEISRLCKIRSIQHEVITNIEQREVYIRRLREIARKVSITGELKDPLVLNELPTVISSLRNVTVQLVESIVRWRKEIPEKQEFNWNGHNYVLTMQNDLDFLKLTDLSPLFGFPLEQNPLLLPLETSQNPPISQKKAQEKECSKPGQKLVIVENQRVSKMEATSRTISSNSFPKIYGFPVGLQSIQFEKWMRRVRQAERIIFQEQLFIQYLRLQKRKNHAATIIQSAWRCRSARKVVKAMLIEKNYLKVYQEYQKNHSKHKLPPRTPKVISNPDLDEKQVPIHQNKGDAHDLSKEWLGPDKLNGRYSGNLDTFLQQEKQEY